jgi:prepilin-type N-terminal cleavage/methylation domain-containing protein
MTVKNEKGFTLVELLIGIMITGILVIASAPNFSRLMHGFRLNGAVRIVWGDIQKARLLAIKEGQTIRMDFTNTSYEISRVPTTEVILRRNLSLAYPGVTVSITNNTVSFGSSGTAGGGGKTVEVQNVLGTKRFTILTTGRIGNIS